MRKHIDLDKVARGLGAERRGKVEARSGYFGAMQLAADVAARFRTPSGGGRSTDPSWTQRRQVPLAPDTLDRLQALAATIERRGHVHVEPLQLAALLLERATREVSVPEATNLVRSTPSAKTTRRPSVRSSS
jgi:hypothetical protein